jgi:hypothetical protein
VSFPIRLKDCISSLSIEGFNLCLSFLFQGESRSSKLVLF